MKRTILKLALYGAAIIMAANVYANDNDELLLNKVTFQLKSEQWLVTKTARVTVVVNAALNDQGIEKIQNSVMQKLSQIAKADWHIVSFNRQQDKAELESVTIHAQARVAQTDLAGLRSSAKSISKPGETYAIDNVEFTPTEEESRAAQAALRNDIYQQAKHELDVLGATYPAQKYYLHQIDFMQSSIVMPMAVNAYATRAAAAAPPLSVGNKAELQATVVLASTPDVPSNLPRTH
jgi:hypothetical protein